jgi:hypothetical protein
MKKRWLLRLIVLCFFLTNCTKDPLNNLSEAESRIYITNYDTTVNFASYKTFRIADSIAVVLNNRLQQRERTDGDGQLIEAVASALQQRGYTRAAAGQGADIGVTVSAVSNTSTQLINYADYGGYYGDYWDPFYWGYPGYSYNFPSYYGIYETGETALVIDMLDIKNASSNNNQFRVIWRGLIRGSGIFTTQNINSQVAALFSQSPYLKNQ